MNPNRNARDSHITSQMLRRNDRVSLRLESVTDSVASADPRASPVRQVTLTFLTRRPRQAG